MGLSGFLGLDIGIDLGTVNTLIARQGEGVILREPSLVAMDEQKQIVAVGQEARTILGRAPGNVQVLHPLQDGVIADVGLCEAMLKAFLERAVGKTARRAGVRAVLCVPGCITEVERKALLEAAKGAGARMAFLLEEPVAAAVGAGLPMEQARATMVVDIGGGTTDAAVLSLGGIVQKYSIRAGGTHMDHAIVRHVKQVHGLGIGLPTAELVKCSIGSALPGPKGSMVVHGRDMHSALPRSMTLNAAEVYEAIAPQLSQLLLCVKEVLSITPPELAGDILNTGLVLTGGGALLKGLPTLLSAELGLPARIAQDPLDCVALGAQAAVENLAWFRSRAG